MDSAKSITDSSNLRPLEEAVLLFADANFQKHYKGCQDHALVDSRELQEASKCMFNYIITVGESTEKRFPELEFMVSNTAILNPLMRCLQTPDIPALYDVTHIWYLDS